MVCRSLGWQPIVWNEVKGVDVSADVGADLNYASYLALDEVLAAQKPVSEVHDELLFIVVHQVHELWFKQLLHDISKLQRELSEGSSDQALATFGRIRRIMKSLTAPMDVLETMLPQQFALFRDKLGRSSGFQSAQFRELEAVLGRRDPGIFQQIPDRSADRQRIGAAMLRPSLFDSFLLCLALHGYPMPSDLLQRDVAQPLAPSAQLRAALAVVYEQGSLEAQLCEALVDLDQAVQEWRYRHVKLVERIIGEQIGTGGSAGAAQLRKTVFGAAFPDLWAARSGR
jgi:tryptophan 2,3-dioxygenase